MTLRGERIVITGGTGFMGSFLVEMLLQAGAAVRVPLFSGNRGFLSSLADDIEWLEGDVRDTAFCGRLLRGTDRLFHLASRRKNVAVHRMLAGEIAADNVAMSLALVTAAAAHPVPTVFVSSATVPDPCSATDISLRQEADGYALGKAAAELLWITASRQYAFPLLLARPVGVYGPRDAFTPDGNVIPSLILKAESAAEAIDVWGSGAAERLFLYVEDAVQATLALSHAGATGVEYIAPPASVTIRALAEQIRDLVAPGKALRFDASKPEGVIATSLPGPHPSLSTFRWTPLAEGLRKTLDWRKRAG